MPLANRRVVFGLGVLATLGAFATLVPAANDDDAPVVLRRLKWDEFVAKVTKNPKAKYTLVDAWATTCGPCKENFPHLVEMHHKYGKQGLAVASLSLDDSSDAKAIEAAELFLRSKKAVITNVVLDEEFLVGYEKLDITAIPAVFLYAPDGTLLRRFTLEDPDDQFTYAEVDAAVASLLKDGTLPSKKPAKAAR